MTRSETAKLVAMLQVLWPGQPVERAMVDVYHAAVGHLPADVAAQAFADAVRTMTFFPKPAEILALADDRASRRLAPVEAWAEVEGRVRRYGSYVGPRWGNDPGPWSSEAVARALDAVGGYRAVCASEDIAIVRAQFLKAYQSLVERARREFALGGGRGLDGSGERAALAEGVAS